MSLTNLSIALLQGWSAAQWTSNNPVLPAYSLGVESDSLKAKFGDGSTAWSSLSYFDPSGGVAAAAWGSITGTLSAQSDLNTALGLKAPLASPTFTTPTLGVASATSLATSAASPLLLTNGKLVTVALTTQTVNPTTLTIPDFASVADTFVFATLAQTLNNKTVAHAAGLVGTPSVTFTGQTDLGLYKVSASQLGISVGGVLVATADGSGLMATSLRNLVNLGTTPVGTVSIVEYGNGRDITTVLTLTNFIVGALAGAAAALGLGNIVCAFPAGQHLELVYALSSLSLKCAGTAVATDTGLGSVIATGAVSVIDGTATFEDRLTGLTINTASGGGAAVSSLTGATAGVATGIALNGTGSVKNVFLNSAGTWNANNTGNLTASGTIILKWTLMS